MSLVISNLHAQIPGREILKGLNLTINPGEVHAIMGPNGSGKSTLSKVLCGHDDYEVTSGEVLLDGQNILDRVKSRSPGMSLATVYNCLEHLTSHGLIKLVHLERGQSRYCANLHEHVHFHCEKCGKVIDAHPSTDFDPTKFWNLPTGTKVSRTDLAIHGTCTNCAAKHL